MELRVCKHCYEGEHGNPEKTAVTRDMVKCAERVTAVFSGLPCSPS